MKDGKEDGLREAQICMQRMGRACVSGGSEMGADAQRGQGESAEMRRALPASVPWHCGSGTDNAKSARANEP